ncbi:nuclear transport factor 2 family protein [Myxococcus sp. K15C18031901]|uniref:nuclear transport factor 2 family protein n=1 Tax=Myxococcus dinghuensis TaxID=2906761 RepID=UPI0020A6E365|nr:nuclear transport factor 2 family protein [Myxococcus dinghuensis]MCP3099902.1 nuclear transport factor 2 family protein [Myxococcus dinghuensis]
MKTWFRRAVGLGGVTLGGVLAGGLALAAPSTSEDEAGARRAVELYLQGHVTGQVAPFQEAFHDEMKMYLNRDGALVRKTKAEYLEGVNGKPAPDETRRKRRIVQLDVTGDVGVAKVELDYPNAFMTDYLTVIKTGGSWKIIGKVVHIQKR